jgi:hypothetical protein
VEGAEVTNTLKIGSVVWKMDQNHRVYIEKDSAPDYRSYWVPVTIKGETSRSWITSWYDEKVPKNGEHPSYAFTEKEVDDKCWVKDYRWRLRERIDVEADADKLRAIAKILDWEPKKDHV